ncbi:rod shape-determining protein [Methylibium petroleiphilum]|uniref:Rod shape-determining-related protein n=1 Tax=Methylibium petroleiphilum (strain ATCC BAA-1232 / LMG 22953 / PM1) TaxID=420662 RepID=A2SCQ0_METPP|nr:rod shape-determining protein [Methylibium petroleiphilum]ABM93339.1 rod shape-determining-related protein [Methylibium petroleiphilum PM1]
MFSAFQPIVYVQISPERLTLRNLKTGESIAEVPELAISAPPKPKILAVGPQARVAAASQPAEVVNPFAHPRSLVSDFTVAEQLLKHQLRKVLGNSLLSLSPCVVVHPLGSPAGGFTQVERRAFREMALGAGASEVHVWTGRPLTDQELLSRRPPPSGGEWE